MSGERGTASGGNVPPLDPHAVIGTEPGMWHHSMPRYPVRFSDNLRLFAANNFMCMLGDTAMPTLSEWHHPRGRTVSGLHRAVHAGVFAHPCCAHDSDVWISLSNSSRYQ